MHIEYRLRYAARLSIIDPVENNYCNLYVSACVVYYKTIFECTTISTQQKAKHHYRTYAGSFFSSPWPVLINLFIIKHCVLSPLTNGLQIEKLQQAVCRVLCVCISTSKWEVVRKMSKCRFKSSYSNFLNHSTSISDSCSGDKYYISIKLQQKSLFPDTCTHSE